MKISIYKQVVLSLRAGLLLLLLIAGSSHAQIPAAPQQQPIIFTNATIHPLTDLPIQAGMLLVEEGKITALGTNLEVPPNARIIDLEGKHIYPAFIHARNLLGLTEIGAVPVTSDFNERGNINPNVRAQVAFHPESSHIGVAAAAGIGLVVSTPSGGIISGLSAAMLTDGWNYDDMTLKAPAGLIINWPNMLNNRNLAKELEELQQAFNKARRYHHAHKANPQLPVDSRWDAMRGVFEGELPVFIHANEISQIQAAMSWAEKEGIQMVLTGARDAAYVAHQLAQHDIPVVITPVISGPARQWDYYGASYAMPAKLHEAGVKFCIAGDFGAASTYRLSLHAAAAVAFGLPEQEALKAITLYPAQILGLDKLMGSLAPGKDASIIITDGNPLEFATQIEKMFIQGREIDMQSKHHQLYHKYRQKQEQSK